jgi:hypothetical protein
VTFLKLLVVLLLLQLPGGGYEESEELLGHCQAVQQRVIYRSAQLIPDLSQARPPRVEVQPSTRQSTAGHFLTADLRAPLRI